MTPERRHRLYYESGRRTRKIGERTVVAGAIGSMALGAAKYIASGGRTGAGTANRAANELLGPLSRGTKWVGRKIFGKRVSRGTANLVSRHPGLRSGAVRGVALARRLRVGTIAPRMIRYGGRAALGGGGLQAYGWLRGGSRSRRERMKASLLRTALYNADDIARGAGALGGISG